MTGLIIQSNVSEDLVPNVTTVIDKKDKLSYQEFNKMLLDIGLNNDQIESLNNYFNLDLNELVNIDNKNNYIDKGLEEVRNLYNILNELNLSDISKFDITLARGQNYYTGNVFEVYDKEQRIKGSIAAGGRYDKMIGNFIGDGEEYPTVGISFGLSSIYEIVKSRFEDEKSDTLVYIIPMDTRIDSIKIANEIRNNGYIVEVELNDRKLKKSMEYANKNKIKYVIIIGTNEIENKILNIKNMYTGDSKSIKIEDINEYIFE